VGGWRGWSGIVQQNQNLTTSPPPPYLLLGVQCSEDTDANAAIRFDLIRCGTVWFGVAQPHSIEEEKARANLFTIASHRQRKQTNMLCILISGGGGGGRYH
jgi:hypothetical protein